MTSTLVVAYLTAGFATVVIVLLTSAHLSDERRPLPQRLGLSLLAGLLWPLMLLGLAELSSFAVIAKAREDREDREDGDVQRLAVLV